MQEGGAGAPCAPADWGHKGWCPCRSHHPYVTNKPRWFHQAGWQGSLSLCPQATPGEQPPPDSRVSTWGGRLTGLPPRPRSCKCAIGTGMLHSSQTQTPAEEENTPGTDHPDMPHRRLQSILGSTGRYGRVRAMAPGKGSSSRCRWTTCPASSGGATGRAGAEGNRSDGSTGEDGILRDTTS